MLVGYNTNVNYKGKLYHVQTEDNGVKNPVVVTLLYIKGIILSSKKTSYADFASEPDCKEKVRELMKEQHKNMIKELVRGKFSEDQEAVPAKEAPEPQAPPPEMPKPVLQASGSPEPANVTKSLDDILLDFIMKKGFGQTS